MCIRDSSNVTDFYCAFVSKDGGDLVNPEADGGDVRYCHNDQVCCNPNSKTGSAFDPSFCTEKQGPDSCENRSGDLGFTWSVGSTWECADKNACNPAEVCCLI